jgi:cytochrome P450
VCCGIIGFMFAEAINTAALAQFSLTQPPAGFVDNPYPWYAALRGQAPVHWLGPQSVLLTRHEDVAQIYREPGVSADKRREFAPKFGDSPLFEHHTTSLVFNDAPLHTRVRRLMLGAVNQRAIARMEAGVAELIEGLLDRMETVSSPDLIDDFAALIPVEVIGNLLGVPRDERGPLRDWSLAILSALEPAPTGAVLAAGNRAVTAFVRYLRGLVAARRSEPLDPAEDVLTRLIQGEFDGERLSEAELLHNCIFLLNAGHETTTNLLGNGLHALLTQRDQWERLLSQPSLLPTAVEELLRFESPLQLNNRLTTQAITVAGHELPSGCFITLAIGAANRDPDVFARPDEIDVARKPNPHLAFGHGAHACAGMNVARLEARLALAGVLRRFPALALAGEPQRDQRVRFRGFRHVPVALGALR